MRRRPNMETCAPALLVEALKVGELHTGDAASGFAYSVNAPAKSADRRLARRRRTRLRSGKILDLHNAFLIECQIYDRSSQGARVRLLADTPAPAEVRLYEDHPERLLDARIVWRKNQEIGLRFEKSPAARKISRTQLTCLRNRYYALGS